MGGTVVSPQSAMRRGHGGIKFDGSLRSLSALGVARELQKCGGQLHERIGSRVIIRDRSLVMNEGLLKELIC